MSSLHIVVRILLYGAGGAGVLFSLPWLSVGAILLLVVLYDAWGAIAIALLMDLAWIPSVSLSRLPLFTIATAALIAIAHPVRTLVFLPSSRFGTMYR